MPPQAGPRVPLYRSLRLSLRLILAGTCFAAVGQIALYLDQPGAPVLALSLFTLTGVVYVAGGVVAWSRRPSSRTGAIMVGAGGAWFAAACLNTGVPYLAAFGLITATAPLAFVLWLLLAFPSGRLRSRVDRGIVVSGFVVAVLLQAPHYLFVADPDFVVSLAVADRPDLARLTALLQSGCGVLVIAATVRVLVSRIRRAPRRSHRVLVAVYAYGILAVLVIPIGSILLRDVLGMSAVGAGLVQVVLVMGVPVVFLVGVLGGGFTPTRDLHEAVSWSPSNPDMITSALVTALSGVLGDESVRLWSWSPERSAYVAGDGQTDGVATELALASDRARIEINAAGRPLAVITYDATVIDDPELVRSAAGMVSIALQNEMLTSELRANQAQLRDSRERLVEAADRERRRIARDLHDGLQVELVLLALRAQGFDRIADRPELVSAEATALRRGIDEAASNLRALVQAVMPPSLLERGLVAAVEDLADRMPVPTRVTLPDREPDVPAAVLSTAYFVVSEGLTNAVKHARATRLSVSVATGSNGLTIAVTDDGRGGAAVGLGTGLRGLADRLDVLGGRLTITSLPNGTRLEAVLPCVW